MLALLLFGRSISDHDRRSARPHGIFLSNGKPVFSAEIRSQGKGWSQVRKIAHRRTLPFGKRWANESQQLDVSTMALTLSFNAAKRVCNRVCGRARLEIQSAFESRRRFTPALIVLPAVCDALFQHFAR